MIRLSILFLVILGTTSSAQVVTWGGSYGADSSSVASELSSEVSTIYSNDYAFAALKEDGSVVTWGLSDRGGDSSIVASELSNGVTTIYSNYFSFAALKDDGSVVTWGESDYGGDSSSVASALSSGVTTIYSNFYAFAALKDDGSVVTWGLSIRGGDSDSVASYLSGGVSSIFSNNGAFAALIFFDADDDGVGDDSDAFPNDPTETVDSDSDGIGDNSDEFPATSTQDVVNAIKSNPTRYNLYSIDDIRDLRAGSTMIAVENGAATLSMEVEQSSDLGIWTTGGTASIQMNVQPGEDKKFFRFKMHGSMTKLRDHM